MAIRLSSPRLGIKISPTFSIPNYVNAREVGVINMIRRGTNRTDATLCSKSFWRSKAV